MVPNVHRVKKRTLVIKLTVKLAINRSTNAVDRVNAVQIIWVCQSERDFFVGSFSLLTSEALNALLSV